MPLIGRAEPLASMKAHGVRDTRTWRQDNDGSGAMTGAFLWIVIPLLMAAPIGMACGPSGEVCLTTRAHTGTLPKGRPRACG